MSNPTNGSGILHTEENVSNIPNGYGWPPVRLIFHATLKCSRMNRCERALAIRLSIWDDVRGACSVSEQLFKCWMTFSFAENIVVFINWCLMRETHNVTTSIFIAVTTALPLPLSISILSLLCDPSLVVVAWNTLCTRNTCASCIWSSGIVYTFLNRLQRFGCGSPALPMLGDGASAFREFIVVFDALNRPRTIEFGVFINKSEYFETTINFENRNARSRRSTVQRSAVQRVQ